MTMASVLFLFIALQTTQPQIGDPTFGRLATLSSTIRWESVPTREQVNSVVPEDAEEQGFVTLTCPVQPDGQLYKNCIVNSAIPAKVGFEEAALSLTHWYKLPEEAIPHETPVAPLVSFSIRFAEDRDGEILKSDRCVPPFCVHEPAL